MERGESSRVGILLLVAIFALSLISPLIARAQSPNAADLMCTGCQMDPTKPRYCLTVPCSDPRSPTGMCALPGVCLGQSYTGLSGLSSGVDTGLSALSKALGPLISQLLQGQSSSPSAGSGAATAGSTDCTGSYYTTSDMSLIGTDPCATYGAPTSLTLTPSGTVVGTTDNTSNSTLSQLTALGIQSNPPVPDTGTPAPIPTPLLTSNTNTSAELPAGGAAVPATLPTPIMTTYSPSDVSPQGGTGAITTAQDGSATLVGSLVTGNSVVAGFYGGSSGTQLCQSQPWTQSGNSLIPSALFASVCDQNNL